MENKYLQLVSTIEKRIEELSLELENSNNKRVDFLDNFFESCNIKNPLTLLNVTVSDLLLALLLETDRETDFDILSSKVEDVKVLLDNMLGKEIIDIIDIISAEGSEERFNILEESTISLLDIHGSKGIILNKVATMTLNKITKKLNKNISYNFKSYDDILKFVKLAKLLINVNKNKNHSIIVLSAYMHSKEKNIKKTSVNKKEKVELNKGEYIISVDKKSFEEEIEFLYDYYKQIEKEVKSQNRNRNKRIYRYAELKKILDDKKEKEEITNIDSILEKILDDDIKKLCLEYIYEHNMKYHKKLYQEFEYKNKNTINKYVSYFNTVGIDFMNLSEEVQKLIMNASVEDIKKRIKLLPIIEMNNDIKINIICNTSIEVVKKINTLLKNGYIDLEVLSNNLEVYYNKTQYDNLLNNICVFEQRNINIRELANKDIMFCSTNIIKNNLDLLDNLSISIKGLNSLDMLGREDLISHMEQLIEIGLETDILNQPELLNSDNNLAKRILIARTIGEDIYEDGIIKKSILDKENFFVTDSEINNYLFDRNNSEYNSSLIIEFCDTQDSKFSYDFEGVKIPKSKVSNLSVSLENLIRTSLYSKDDIKVLEKYSK